VPSRELSRSPRSDSSLRFRDPPPASSAARHPGGVLSAAPKTVSLHFGGPLFEVERVEQGPCQQVAHHQFESCDAAVHLVESGPRERTVHALTAKVIARREELLWRQLYRIAVSLVAKSLYQMPAQRG
jgi:hypothetical protein